MAKKSKKAQQGNDLLENPDAIAEQISRSEQFVKNNLNIVLGAIVLVVLIIAGVMYFRSTQMESTTEAQQELFRPQLFFERDSLDRAIYGDGNALGFENILEDYSGTDAANLSHFYMGVISLKKGEYEEAISHLQDFSSSDLLVQARAYSLVGDAYVGAGNNVEAAKWYDKAAAFQPTKEFSPIYLQKAAITYENLQDYNAAIDRYKQIVDKFPESTLSSAAKKHKSRLEQKAS